MWSVQRRDKQTNFHAFELNWQEAIDIVMMCAHMQSALV